MGCVSRRGAWEAGSWISALRWPCLGFQIFRKELFTYPFFITLTSAEERIGTVVNDAQQQLPYTTLPLKLEISYIQKYFP